MSQLFSYCFDVLSGPSKADSGEELSKNVEHHMTAVLAILVDESQTLPAEVVDVILAQFLRADPRVAPTGSSVAVGDRFVVAGYGLATRGDGKTGGTVRAATLVATGAPGSLQIRLVDPATKGDRAGLGACTGDSGAPVFRDTDGVLAVIGVVSWSTGPNMTDGCGGLTGVTPLARYRGWIVEQAGKMGRPLP